MTQDRELEIESRLTALETTVAELKRLVEAQSNRLWNFFGSASGGVVVALVTWWITKK